MDLTKRLLFVLTFSSLCVVAQAQPSFNESSIGVLESDISTNDVTAPSTDLLRTEARDFIFGPATRIKFKIIEEESGLETTYFKIADLPYMKSDGRQMVPHQLTDGSYSIKYYSVDKAGNQEQIRKDEIYIDKKGPIINAGFNASPNSFENGLPIFSKDVKLEVKASDEKVEVHKLTYQINDGPIVRSDNTDFIDLSEELRQVDTEQIRIEIRAYDTFYNLSKEVVEFVIKK